MFKGFYLKAAVRRAVVVGAVLGATVAAQATVISYTSMLLSGVGTGVSSDTTSLLQFNPGLGTLTSVTVFYADFAFSESSITNLTTKSRYASQSSFASDAINVSTGFTINTGGFVTASTSLVSPALGAGLTSDLTNSNFGGGSSTYTSASDLAEFTGFGALSVTNTTTTSGSAVGQGNYFAFTNNFAAGQAAVVYTYRSVPSPAAAATMLIGVVGGLARRRRSA